MSSATEAPENEGSQFGMQWACENGTKEGAMQEVTSRGLWKAARFLPIREVGEVDNNIGINNKVWRSI